MTLHEFEEKIGKKIEEINIDDVKKLSQDTELLTVLNEDTKFSIELANKVIETNPDESVKAEFFPIKWHYALYDSQITLSQMFAQFKVDEDTEKLVGKIKEFLKSATPLGKLNTYLVILTAFEDFDLTEYKEDVQSSMKDVEEILFKEIDPETCFPVACDIVDELYHLQQLFFEKYGVDVIAEDADKINEYVEKLSKIAEPLYETMKENIDQYVPEDAKPEDIGLLDVTKLKEKGEE